MPRRSMGRIRFTLVSLLVAKTVGFVAAGLVILGFAPTATLAQNTSAAPTQGPPTSQEQGPREQAAALARFEFSEPHMGVNFKIVLYATDEKTANKAARAAFDRVEALNRIMSDYDPESELSRLSDAAGSGRNVPVCEELWTVLSAAQQLASQSEGAFDVTVGAAVKLWRRARRAQQLPDAELLAAARETIGHGQLILDPDQRTARLERSGTRLDLGGIAKGYAADEALRVLRERGAPRALVAASGDVVLGDPPPQAPGWRVAIAPLDPRQPAERYLTLSNAAVSTSGDAYQYVEIEARRYSHILDPRTGVGLTSRASVTVVARRGIESDSLASAVCVLGPGAGLQLIESLPRVEALLVLAEAPHSQEPARGQEPARDTAKTAHPSPPIEQLSSGMQNLFRGE